MSANNSVMLASSNTNQAAMNTQTLLSLPAELIDTVAMNLSKQDLLSFRATCRQLRDSSAFTLCQNHLSIVWISGTSTSFQELTNLLLSPNLPQAQHFATILGIAAPSVDHGWPVDYADLRKRFLPSATDVARLLAAMPNLVDIRLSQHQDVLWYDESTVHYAPVLLRSLNTPGSLQSHLRKLFLTETYIDGSLLTGMLEMYKDSLEEVSLTRITRTGKASWLDIMSALHSTEVSSIKLMLLNSKDERGVKWFVSFLRDICTLPLGEHHQEGIGESYISSKQAKSTLETIVQHRAVYEQKSLFY